MSLSPTRRLTLHDRTLFGICANKTWREASYLETSFDNARIQALPVLGEVGSSRFYIRPSRIFY